MTIRSLLIKAALLGVVLAIAAAVPAKAQTIQNPSFETPYVGPYGNANGLSPDYTFEYYYSFENDPAEASWTFTGPAGIAANGSGYAFFNTGTPDGNQFAFLQYVQSQGVGGTMSQTISGFAPGTYAFTFYASQRDTAGRDNSQNQGVIVQVDGAPVGSFTPADTNWYYCVTTPVALGAGSHVLTFSTLVAAVNATVRVDMVEISNAVQIPVAPAITNQPGNDTVSSGSNPVLSVSVSGTPPYAYQWYFDGAALPAGTNATLTLTNFSAAAVGSYYVAVTNAVGGVLSQPFTVASVDIHRLASVYVNGPVGSNYLIQTAGSPAGSWTTRTNLALPTQPYIYVDYASVTNQQQFYRAVPQ